MNVLGFADAHRKYLQASGFNFCMSSLQLSDPMTAHNSTKVAQEAEQSRLTRPHLTQMDRLTVAIQHDCIGGKITYFEFADYIHDF